MYTGTCNTVREHDTVSVGKHYAVKSNINKMATKALSPIVCGLIVLCPQGLPLFKSYSSGYLCLGHLVNKALKIVHKT